MAIPTGVTPRPTPPAWLTSNVAGTTVNLSDTTTQTIVEPTVTITKATVPATISPAPDAGDLFKYRITVSNPGGTNYSTAYNVRITDTLPADVDLLTVTVTSSASWVDSSNLASDRVDVMIDSIANLGSVTIDLDVRLRTSVQPNTTIANTGYATWTSMPGTVAGERTGSTADEGGSANDYRANGVKSFTSATVALSKFIVSTSESDTAVCPGGVGACSSPWSVAIGEVVRYRLIAAIPEGTSTNLQLQDVLPNNLIFINDGTAQFGICSRQWGGLCVGYLQCQYRGSQAGCGVTGAAASATFPAGSLPCGLADANVGSSNSSTTNTRHYLTGTDPFFKLGTFHNNDSDADTEYVVVEFNALVENSLLNQAFVNSTGATSSTSIVNSFRVYVNAVQKGVDSTGSSSNQASIAEPVIRDLTKTRVGSGTLDAGDTLTYRLTFSNNASGSNAAPAYNVVLTDTLDSNLSFQSVTITDLAEGVESYNAAGNLLNVYLTKVSAGSSVTVDVTAVVKASAPNGMIISNNATLSYTSLPGTNGTTGNSTGSDTPGTAGTANGERIGITGSTLNDYRSASEDCQPDACNPNGGQAEPVADGLHDWGSGDLRYPGDPARGADPRPGGE